MHEEFRWERQDLLGKIRQMEGTQELIDEYGRVGHEGKMALLLGREGGERVDYLC